MKPDKCIKCGAVIVQSIKAGRPRLYCDACKQLKSRPALPRQPEQPPPPSQPEL